MSKSNSGDSSSDSDGNSSSDSDESISSKKNQNPKTNIKGNWYLKKIDDRVKDKTIIINKGFSKTPFGKYFGYSHGPSGSIFNISLPCPVQ